MPKMTNCGITIDVPTSDVSFYLRAGYKKVEEGEPVTNPASEPSTSSEFEEKSHRGRRAAAPSNTELPAPQENEGEK